MGQFFAIGVPEGGPFQFEIAAFRAQLHARWPGADLAIDPTTHLYTFALPTIPLGAALDPAAPGGLVWRPALSYAQDGQGPDRRWQLALALPDHPARFTLSPDLRAIWTEGTILDCVVCALWLRRWLPPEVPLTAGDGGYTHTAVTPGITIPDLTRRMLLDLREHDRAERAWADANMERVPGGWRAADGNLYLDPEIPQWEDQAGGADLAAFGLPPLPQEDPALTAMMRELLFRLLGAEAKQFFMPSDAG